MRLPLRPTARFATALLVASLAVCLSGCVYLRLLELKQQFAKFDRYFQVDTQDGLKLTFLTPVLLDEDMAFFKLAPEKREKVGTAERWHFRWIKANGAPGERPENYEVSADFIFSQHKLAKVILPERLFAFFPKTLVVGMLRSLGDAKIDREKRSATSNYKGDASERPFVPLNREQIVAALGEPMEKTTSPEGQVWRYRYVKATPDQSAGNIDVNLSFSAIDDKMTRLKGSVFGATIDMGFAEPPAINPTAATPLSAPDNR